MTPDYTAAFYGSLLGIAIICALFLIIGVLVIVFDKNETLINKSGYLLVLLIFLFLMGLAAFPIVYAISNLLAQKSINWELLRIELQNGILGLRVASVLIGLKALLNLFRDFIDQIFGDTKKLPFGLGAFIRSRQSGYPEIDGLNEQLKEDDIDWLVAAQYLFYVVVIVSLWSFAIYNIHTTDVLLLNWALFFVVDDWVIVSDYVSILKGRLLKGHFWRIGFFNCFISILLSISIFIHYPLYIGVFTTSVIIILLMIHYGQLGTKVVSPTTTT